MKKNHMLFSLIVVYIFISSQMVLGQLPSHSLILGCDATLLLMNGEGKLGDMDLDVTRNIFSDDLEKAGFGWDNKSLFGIRPSIGYKIFPRLAFIGSYNCYFKKTVNSSEDISTLGFSSDSFAGKLNASMEYSQKTIQLLGQFYLSTKLGLFLAAGIEFMSIKSELTTTIRISDPVYYFSFQEDSKYRGSDNASGLVFGSGFELPLPIQNFSLQATALYSLSKYKGEDLLKLDEPRVINDESGIVEYDEQNSEMELGVGGLSASVGLRMHLFGSKAPSKREFITEKKSNIGFGIGTGISKTLGDGSEYWNIGLNANGNLFYSLLDNVSIGGRIAYNRWGANKEKVMSELRSSSPSDYSIGGISGSINIIEISPNIKFLTTQREHQQVQFFAQAGIGYYIMNGKAQYDYSYKNSSSGNSYSREGNVFIEMEDNKIGLNIGAGIIINSYPNMSFEINPVYHMIFTEEESTKYFTVNVGIIFGK